MGLLDTVKGWFGVAKKSAADAADAAKPHVDKAVKGTKETAADLSEKAKPHVDKAKEKMSDMAAAARDKAQDTVSESGSGDDGDEVDA